MTEVPTSLLNSLLVTMEVTPCCDDENARLFIFKAT